jgi:3-hydroxybutyryl-CoA dehydratase
LSALKTELNVIEFGAFAVRTEKSDVVEFARELLCDQNEFGDIQSVPFTFPIRWLAVPTVRDYLANVSGRRGLLLIREEIVYKERLQIDCDYLIRIDFVERASARPTIEIRGSVYDELNRAIVSITSTLCAVEMQSDRVGKKYAAPVANNADFVDVVIGPIQQSWISRYAAVSLDYNPLHIDNQFARMQGLPNTIVHGTLLSGLLSNALGHWCPNSQLNRLSVTFLLPVFEGSSVRIVGHILNQKQLGTSCDTLIRLKLQLDDGRMAAVGEANLLANNPKC